MRFEYRGDIGDARVDVLVIAISQHYRLARRLVKSAGTGKGRKVSMTAEDSAASRYLSDVIAKYGGRSIGAYCSERFERAVNTLDLRSYKIKFALIRLREIFKILPVHGDIVRRMDFLVELAERLAGCVPDEKRRGKSSRKPVETPLLDSVQCQPEDQDPLPVLKVSIPGFDDRVDIPEAMKAQRTDERKDAKTKPKSCRSASYERMANDILRRADGRGQDDDCEDDETAEGITVDQDGQDGQDDQDDSGEAVGMSLCGRTDQQEQQDQQEQEQQEE